MWGIKKGMGKIAFIGLMLSTTSHTYSQIGINTNKPQTDLDINGDLQIRGEIRLEENSTINTGESGQYLMSQGPGLPPTWGDIEIPELNTGDYLLTETTFAEDRIGVDISTISTNTISEDSKLDGDWSVVEGLTSKIKITEERNRMMFTTQTVVQSSYADVPKVDRGNLWFTVMCGIFIGKEGEPNSNFKLVSVRQGYIKGGHYPQLAFQVTSSYDNMAAGEYLIKVAYQRREQSSHFDGIPVYFGKSFNTTPSITNSFMNKSVIRVDLFESTNKDGSEGGIIGG